MNVRKRGLALLMCICMIFTLLPFSALADATTQDGDIVYGTYGTDGKWKGDNNLNDTATHPLSGENELTLTKTATKIADNTYRIDLKVVMTQTTSTTPPGSAATVLVIDTSGSMDICATCNKSDQVWIGGPLTGHYGYTHKEKCKTGHSDEVKYEDTRLAAAKEAAISFLNKYKGTSENASRYVSVVTFNTYASVTQGWLDVSVPANYTAVVNAINGLSANGGTNLDQALFNAKAQFSADTVKDIPASAKNVIALTDGCPTYYGNGIDQHGSYGCPDTNNTTADTATKLKKVAGVYTVCFGAANEKCWAKGSIHEEGILGFGEKKHEYDGPKVGDFLKDNIATSASHAYNADNTTELMSAFEAITNTIVNGLNSGTVTDPMGDNVSLVGTVPSGFVTNDNGRTYTWELSGAPGVTNGDKTTYTYEKSYTVKLDTSGDDEYHPLNGRTTFTADGKIYDFNVPGVYREAKYTVTYKPGDHGTLTDADNSGNVVHPNLKKGTATPAAPTVNAEEGYYFTGWKPTVAKIVTGDAEYIAQYEKKNEITVVAKSATKTYDGSEQSISGFEHTEFTINGKVYTVSGLTASVSGIDANDYTNEVTGTAVVKDDNGNDVTGQFTVKTQDGTLTIKQAEVTITADNKEKFVDEADPQFTYTISGIVEADKDKKVTLTIIRDKVGTPEGELAGSYSIIPKDASIEGSNNYTFKYVNGTLTIKERNAITVTLTATKLLDGEDATGSEFEFELYQIVEGKEVRIEKVENNNAAINFTPIQFNKEGTYIYYIREITTNSTYVVCDGTIYAAVVAVTPDNTTGSFNRTVTYSEVKGNELSPTTDNKAVFHNTTKPTGSLTISKTISGNAASTTKEFTFIVKLIPNSDTTNNNIIYGNVTNVTVIDDEISFKLKAGDSKTINGLPDGIRYTVQELDSNGYTVSAKVNDDPVPLENNMLEGTIAAGVETKIVFNNHKSHVYPPNPPIMDEIIVEITGNSDSVVYDGTEHSVKGYTVKISDPRYTEADFTFTGKAEASGVNAGTYEMGLKAEQFKNTNARFTNVKFVIKADGVLTITPKDLTITAGSKTEYGPTPVTCDEWTVSGLVAGDKVESVKITGIQSVPGSSPNVPSDAVIKNAKGEDVTKNYAIKYVNGTLTMLEVLNKEDHFNYIIGTPEGLSLPTANVTRAEVATIFFRLMTDDARAKFDSLDNNFSDVAKGKWYNRAISTLANAGIVKGDPAGTYRPGDPITRAEMAAIIARFGDFKEGGKTFNDISGHWAQKYIELAASNGWINGNPDGTFKPNNNITRAETVAMINRVLDRQTKDVSDLLPVSQMTNWSDNMDTAKWYYRDMQEATNNHKAERVGNSIYEKWTEKLPDIDWASYQI